MFEGIAIAILLIVVGAIRVVPQLIEGGTWGAEASLAAVLMGLGFLALGIELRSLIGRLHGPRPPRVTAPR